MKNARIIVLAIVAAVMASMAAPAAPTFAATFTVNSTGDAGDATPDGICDSDPGAPVVCTLREAIQEANFVAGADTINFNIPPAGAKTINVGASGLPDSTAAGGSVTIDGTTQPGFAGSPIIELNGSAGAGIGLGLNSTGSTIKGLVINRFQFSGVFLGGGGNHSLQGNYIGVDLAGTSTTVGNGTDGLLIGGSGGNCIGGQIISSVCTVTAGGRNVISGNGSAGIEIQSTGNSVIGNHIGTNATGTAALGNAGRGIEISGGSNTIGGTDGTTPGGSCTGVCNIISSNLTFGIEINGSGGGVVNNVVQGNHIGADVSGTLDLGNDAGVAIVVASSNIVGASSPSGRNIISGNQGSGVVIFGATSTVNTVTGNYIGTQTDGVTSLPNLGAGVHIMDSASDNTIGGAAGGANVIRHNGGDGIFVDSGTGNWVARNVYSNNGGLGVDLAPGGVNLNDDDDLDTGANNRQNYPDLFNATKIGASIRITGTISSTPNGAFIVFFYHSASCDPSTFGEGETEIGFTSLTANANGEASIDVTFPVSIPLTRFITSIAYDPQDNTSEFSECLNPGPMLVNSTADPGVGSCDGSECTLREAILAANGDADADIIFLFIPAATDPGCVPATGVCTITPTSAFPPITSPLDIRGETQAGATLNSNPTNMANNAALKIELNGTSAGAGQNGLVITGGSSLVRGLVINRFGGHGIVLQTGDNNTIQENFIGTNVAGSADLGNGLDGVSISIGSTGNSVGSNTAGNLISGNDDEGISILGSTTTDNQVVGNIIGLSAAGNADLGNAGNGVEITGPDTIIGGSASGDLSRNVISGNNQNGIQINNTSGAYLAQNYIGTDVTGVLDIGNSLDGVTTSGTASGAFIGGLLASERNVISGNNGKGVFLSGIQAEGSRVNGNYIGTNATGTGAVGNTGAGVDIDTRGNEIGGTHPGDRNIIGGNGRSGVSVRTSNSGLNNIHGNSIGIQLNGDPIGNGSHGVFVVLTSVANHIGGAGAGETNTIAFNGGDGVRVDNSQQNDIHRNSIHHNVGKGIETINGGNGNLAPPVITGAGASSVSGTACANCTIEVFSDSSDEGRFLEGVTTANGSGNWTLAFPASGPYVTATATDASLNTSEFAVPVACPDSDADGYCDGDDPCPAIQDCDGDGWADGWEALFIGTLPQVACASNGVTNAWPPDFNIDGSVTGADLSTIAGVIGQGVPPAPLRRDVNQPPDESITGADLSAVAALVGTSCT